MSKISSYNANFLQQNYVTGFARIGEQRELKKVLEEFWAKKVPFSEVEAVASLLRKRHWSYQKDAGIAYISSNDFSFYDTMLDTSLMLGAIPKRFQHLQADALYFAMARGDEQCPAMEMTKWFNTNYHYIVPELSANDHYTLNASKIINEYKEAKALGIKTKINIIGPLTYLGLSKRIDAGETYTLIDKVLPLYEELFEVIATLDDTIVIQIDEPIFTKDLDTKVLSLIKPTYKRLATVSKKLKLIVMSYFDHACEATNILVHTPIWGIGLDFVHGEENIHSLQAIKDSEKMLIAGVIDGRNIWKNDFASTLKLLEKIGHTLPSSQLIIATSCSLLHVPFTLKYETQMDQEIKSWLSFGIEKLHELSLISKVYFHGFASLNNDEKKLYQHNIQANQKRRTSLKIHDQAVIQRVKNATRSQRDGAYHERIQLQKKRLKYEDLATTTIGSFPQTPQIREARSAYKKSLITQEQYQQKMQAYIDECVAFQEDIGLDILVHGEPERNDMVEYFGQQLRGVGFSHNGWVQSYGSRCVKPPFIYGDISRPQPMTVKWITYAQSKTDRIMKGMLTGPVTILNWSFVRDDKPRAEIAKQIALAMSDEVDDLQNAGIQIIQVDEAAFKEGYPLRKKKIQAYEKWAVDNFKLSVSSAKKETQIHTHMCYSEFNDIIKTIEAMDADVISIETARSGNTLLKIFQEVGYKQEVGPGVYDIHSPRIPSVEEIVQQIENLLKVLPKEQLWINPDCGLKTRKWEEVRPSLKNMVQAVKIVREKLQQNA